MPVFECFKELLHPQRLAAWFDLFKLVFISFHCSHGTLYVPLTQTAGCEGYVAEPRLQDCTINPTSRAVCMLVLKALPPTEAAVCCLYWYPVWGVLCLTTQLSFMLFHIKDACRRKKMFKAGVISAKLFFASLWRDYIAFKSSEEDNNWVIQLQTHYTKFESFKHGDAKTTWIFLCYNICLSFIQWSDARLTLFKKYFYSLMWISAKQLHSNKISSTNNIFLYLLLFMYL